MNALETWFDDVSAGQMGPFEDFVQWCKDAGNDKPEAMDDDQRNIALIGFLGLDDEPEPEHDSTASFAAHVAHMLDTGEISEGKMWNGIAKWANLQAAKVDRRDELAKDRLSYLATLGV
jgi:hypothetical protein